MPGFNLPEWQYLVLKLQDHPGPWRVSTGAVDAQKHALYRVVRLGPGDSGCLDIYYMQAGKVWTTRSWHAALRKAIALNVGVKS